MINTHVLGNHTYDEFAENLVEVTAISRTCEIYMYSMLQNDTISSSYCLAHFCKFYFQKYVYTRSFWNSELFTWLDVTCICFWILTTNLTLNHEWIFYYLTLNLSYFSWSLIFVYKINKKLNSLVETFDIDLFNYRMLLLCIIIFL